MPPARPGGDKAPFSTGPLRSGAKAAPGGPRPAPAPRSSDRRHRSLPQRQAGGEGSAGLPPPPGPPARSPQGGKGDGSPGKTPPPGAAPSPSSRGGGVTEPRPEPLSSAPAAASRGPRSSYLPPLPGRRRARSCSPQIAAPASAAPGGSLTGPAPSRALPNRDAQSPPLDQWRSSPALERANRRGSRYTNSKESPPSAFLRLRERVPFGESRGASGGGSI